MKNRTHKNRHAAQQQSSVATDSSIANYVRSQIVSDTTAGVDVETFVEFAQLANKWERETEHLSSTARMKQHPQFAELLGLGSKAIPFALERLKTRHVKWFLLLEALATDPPNISQSNQLYEVKKAWLHWGREHGFTD